MLRLTISCTPASAVLYLSIKILPLYFVVAIMYKIRDTLYFFHKQSLTIPRCSSNVKYVSLSMSKHCILFILLIKRYNKHHLTFKQT